MKKILVIIIFSLIVLTACTTAPKVQESQVTIPPGHFYFHSTNCSHCATVNSFVEENKIKEKVFFVSKEISLDREAYSLAKAVGERCGLNESELAVPLFWDGSSCYLGEVEVINFFKTKIQ